MTCRWVLWYVVMLHLAWAGLVLLDARALETIPLSLFAPLGHILTALVLGVATMAAVVGLRRPEDLWSLLLIVPQQLMVWMVAGQAAWLIVVNIDSATSDAWTVLTTRHIGLGLVAIFHTATMIELFGPTLARWKWTA